MIQMMPWFFLLFVLIAVTLWCWLSMDSLLFSPDRIIYPVRVEKGYRFQEIYTGEGRRKIHGWYVTPEKISNPMVMLVCHGTKGNLSTPFRVDLVRTLSRVGVEFFIFDYRGGGKSPGGMTQASAGEDALAAWNYLVMERNIPRERIIVFGRSLGGPVAARLASFTEPALLILESTFESVMAEAHNLFPLLPRRLTALFLKGRFKTVDYLRDLSCPVVFLHGTCDRLVPFRLGVQLFRKSPQVRKILLPLKGLGHKGFSVNPELYVDALNKGLQAFLPSFRTDNRRFLKFSG